MADESARGIRLGVRLFLEGIEIPVESVTVTAGMMGPAQARVTIPAAEGVLDLKPRTLVHIFYFNNNRYRSPIQKSSDTLFVDNKALNTGQDGDTEDPEAVKLSNPHRWHLLFVGEVMGYKYLKQTTGEKVALECKDFTQYWDDAKIYLGKKGPNSRHFKQALFMGAVTGTRGKRSVIKSHSDITKILRTRPSTIPTLQGLLGGIVHLLESVTGIYHNSSTKKHRGINDFISAAEMRLKLTKTLAACPTDLSSRTFTRGNRFGKFVKQTVTQMSGTANYTTLIRVLLDNIFHIYYPILAPPYMDDSFRASFIKMVPNSHALDPKATAEEKLARKALKTTRDAIKYRSLQVDRNATLDDEPGAANVDLPNVDNYHLTMVNVKGVNQQTHDSWKTRAWRLKKVKGRIMRPEKLADARARVQKLPLSKSFTSADRTQLSDLLRATEDVVGQVYIMAGPLSLGYTDPVTGARGDHYPNMTRKNFVAAVTAQEKAEQIKVKHRPKFKPKQMQMPLSDRLYLTGFCPNIWMCPPPVCNVIFPDQYSMLSFTRNWMSEPTRLWLFGMKNNGRADMSVKYFAPNTNIIIGPGKMDVAKAASNSKSFLLHHELFTGVIASFEGVGQGKALLKQMKETDKEAKKYGEGLTNLYKFGSKNKALDRTATTKFLSARFMNRSITVNCTFNPGLVVGLPAVVINPHRRPDVKGSHVLGVIANINHVVTQKGAQTTVKMNWARSYDEGLELFDPNADTSDGTVSIIKDIPKWRGGKVVAGDKQIWAEVHGWKTKRRIRTVTMDRQWGGGTRQQWNENVLMKVKGAKLTSDVGFHSGLAPTMSGAYPGAAAKMVKIKMRSPYITWYPIVGMMGLTGRKGRHITQGLAHQASATVGRDGDPKPGALELAGGLDTTYGAGVTQDTFYNPFDAQNYAAYKNLQYDAITGKPIGQYHGLGAGPTQQQQIEADPIGVKNPYYEPSSGVKGTGGTTGGVDYTTERAVIAAQFKWSYYIIPKRFVGKGIGQSGATKGDPPTLTGTHDPTLLLAQVAGPIILDEYKYRKRLSWMSSRALCAVEVNAYKSGQGGGGKRKWNFTFEQVARPAWMHKTYLNQNIGQQYYGPILGCKSIVDLEFQTDYTDELSQALGEGYEMSADKISEEHILARNKDFKTLTPVQIKQIAQSRGSGSGTKTEDAQKAMADLIGEILADPVHKNKSYVKVVIKRGKSERELVLPAAILGGRPIQLSVAQIAGYYKHLVVGEGNKATRDFVDRYTVRKHASMVDIFGWGWIPGELTWAEEGQKLKPNADPHKYGTERDHATNSSIPIVKRGILGTRHLDPSELYGGYSWLEKREWDGKMVDLKLKDWNKMQKLSQKNPELYAEWERSMSNAREGFHSAAFGPLENLALLEHESLYDVNGRKKRKLNPKADPRQERYTAVREYKEKLAMLQYVNDDSITKA